MTFSGEIVKVDHFLFFNKCNDREISLRQGCCKKRSSYCKKFLSKLKGIFRKKRFYISILPCRGIFASKVNQVSPFQRHWIYKRQLHHHWPLGLGAVKCKLVESGGSACHICHRKYAKLWFSHPMFDAGTPPVSNGPLCRERNMRLRQFVAPPCDSIKIRHYR